MKGLTYTIIKVFVCTSICCALLAGTRQAVHAQTGGYLFNVRAILPGTTQSIDLRQQQEFPFGCPQFYIAVLGKGTLGISVRKDDNPGDIIYMLGVAYSSAGTFPIYRLGVSKGMIDQIIEIGDSDQPYGFVWLSCGVAYSNSIPVFVSQLRLSLAP